MCRGKMKIFLARRKGEYPHSKTCGDGRFLCIDSPSQAPQFGQQALEFLADSV